MFTDSSNDNPSARILTGRDATARFIELLSSDQDATMRWCVCKSANLDEAFYRVEGSRNSLHRRLQKDQSAGRNIGLRIGSHAERGQWQSLGAVYVEFGDEFDDYIDFHLRPDFVVAAGRAFWTAYWLTTEADPSKLRDLRYALARHYGERTTRYARAQPVPGFKWIDRGECGETTLIDYTGKSLGDDSHFEGLHTLSEMYEGLSENAELRFTDQNLNLDKEFDPLENDDTAASSEGYFSCYMDGEEGSAIAGSDLVSNFLPDDALYMIYGPTGSLKTFVMLDLAYTAASGEELWPQSSTSHSGAQFKAIDHLKVAFIAGEGQSDFHRRVSAWKKHHDITRKLDVLVINEMPRFDSQTHLRELIRTISNKLGYVDILVIDTLMEASAGFNISDPANSREFMLACKYLRRHLLSTVCLIHHTGKDRKGHLGAEHLKAAIDVMDKVEAKSNSSGPSIVRISQEKNRDHRLRADILLEAIEIDVGADQNGNPVTSLALKRQGNPGVPAFQRKDGVLGTAMRVLEDAKGTGPLSVQELVARMIDLLPAANLAGKDRAKEVEKLRKAVSALAKGGLTAHAKRGLGKTAPWQFEITDSAKAMAAE